MSIGIRMIELDYVLCKKLMPYARKSKILTFLEPLNKTFQEFDINTQERVAMFMAQIAIESGSLQYVEEIASGKAYDNRIDLGNTVREAVRIAYSNGSTPGVFYKGRGLIQITGYSNYLACGKALNLPLTTQPTLLCEPMHAARSAGWFFKDRKCNYFADQKNPRIVTRIINGGYNHYNERLASYNNNLKVFGVV